MSKQPGKCDPETNKQKMSIDNNSWDDSDSVLRYVQGLKGKDCHNESIEGGELNIEIK